MAKGIAGNKVRTITCAGCGETVTRRMRPGTKYCSLDCYRSAPSRPQRRTGENRSCERCGTEFYVHANRIAKGDGRFCSLACHNTDQGRNMRADRTGCIERIRQHLRLLPEGELSLDPLVLE